MPCHPTRLSACSFPTLSNSMRCRTLWNSYCVKALRLKPNVLPPAISQQHRLKPIFQVLNQQNSFCGFEDPYMWSIWFGTWHAFEDHLKIASSNAMLQQQYWVLNSFEFKKYFSTCKGQKRWEFLFLIIHFERLCLRSLKHQGLVVL